MLRLTTFALLVAFADGKCRSRYSGQLAYPFSTNNASTAPFNVSVAFDIRSKAAPPIALATVCGATPVLVCALKVNNNNVLLCQLTMEPKVGATIALSSTQADLTINKCSLVFTRASWNVSQSVTMNPIYDTPRYNNSTAINIAFTVDAAGESFNSCGGTIVTSRRVDKLQYATGYAAQFGDPHIQIFSEKGYKPLTAKMIAAGMSMNVAIHAQGVFYAVKSNMGLTIQTQYGKCMGMTSDPHQPTCVIGVFLQYKSEFVSIQIPNSVYSNKTVIRNATVSGFLDLNQSSGNVYLISIKDGIKGTFDSLSSTVLITPFSHKSIVVASNGSKTTIVMNYFNVETRLSPIHYQQTQGHLGSFDYSPQLRDSQTHLLFNGDVVYRIPFYDNYTTGIKSYNFTQSFAVPDAENGMNSTAPIAFARFASCATAVRRSKRAVYTLEDDIETNQTALSSDSIPQVKSSVTLESAKAQCITCFHLESTVLEELSNDAILSCASDVMASGSDVFCSSNSLLANKILLALAQDSNYTLAFLNQTAPRSAQNLALMQYQSLLASTDYGSGVKQDGVCHCLTGTSGTDCSVKVASQLYLNAATGQASASASLDVRVNASLLMGLLVMALFL